jgi:hypothetical protein
MPAEPCYWLLLFSCVCFLTLWRVERKAVRKAERQMADLVAQAWTVRGED